MKTNRSESVIQSEPACRNGFTLLDLGRTGDAAEMFRRSADALNIPMKIISEDNPDACAFYGAALVLVRPDQFVAWAANEAPDDCAGVLRRVIGYE